MVESCQRQQRLAVPLKSLFLINSTEVVVFPSLGKAVLVRYVTFQ